MLRMEEICRFSTTDITNLIKSTHLLLQWSPLIVITSGRGTFDNNKRLITINNKHNY